MIRIAPSHPDDVRASREVVYRTWLATYPNLERGISVEDIAHHFRDVFSEPSIAAFARRLAEPHPDEIRLDAWRDDTLVGVCRVLTSLERLKLQMIYVLPEHQRLGIGRALWQEALRSTGPRPEAIVHVASYNARAIAFYESLGFVDTGKRWESDLGFLSGALLPEMEMVARFPEVVGAPT
ncbi:MAG: GNAT family N-acetyltransferase [Bauldia sp.]|nr:GNAT family N-acetyltransferase [Bauldia sp.]